MEEEIVLVGGEVVQTGDRFVGESLECFRVFESCERGWRW